MHTSTKRVNSDVIDSLPVQLVFFSSSPKSDDVRHGMVGWLAGWLVGWASKLVCGKGEASVGEKAKGKTRLLVTVPVSAGGVVHMTGSLCRKKKKNTWKRVHGCHTACFCISYRCILTHHSTN